jgi:putative ABC transport system permease protein
MNLFQLVIKQMRQRALSTWLTLLSVLLGVGLATAILLFQREGGKLFGQSDFGYDMVIGPKGSKLQLVLNSVYHLSSSPGLIPYSYYEDFPQMDGLEWAVPYAVGDEYQGYRIVGTLPKLFKGFPQAREQLAGLIPLQRQLVGKETDSPADVLSRLDPQKAIRDRLDPIYKDLELEAPDAAARIKDAMDKLDGVVRTLQEDAGKVNPFAQQKDATNAIIAAMVLTTGPAEYRRGQHFELAEGRLFHPKKFEAVVGSDVAKRGGLKIGSQFKPQHGTGGAGEEHEQHKEQWTVVGVLKPTHTANDRVIFIPLVSFYAIEEHEEALSDISHEMGIATTQPAHGDETQASTRPTTQHAAHHHGHTINPDGTIDLEVPKNQWMLAAILARSKPDGVGATDIAWHVNNGRFGMAVNPATEMYEFFKTFLEGSGQLLLLISAMVTIVAAVSILVSIYNSVSARRKEIAILRALGATRGKVLALICIEAGLIGLLGGIGGLIVGHLLGAGGSIYLQALLGEGIQWTVVSGQEIGYLLAVVALATLAGLVPAAKAYRTPVATNLVAS